jgi:dihydroorotate dehydrogenase electron transfer subunit
MNIEQPIMLKIEKVIDEAKDIKTFIFNHALDSKPGQFVSVWIPGMDEKPFSVSYQDREKFAITCFSAGPFSAKLNTLKAGDKVGIRGPYGNGFTLKRGNIALVGGGCGTAPMAFLANELKKIGSKVIFITGSRNADYILYKNRMQLANIEMQIATDDGSQGYKGFATDLLDIALEKNPQIEMVYTCGPEIMMKKIIDICEKHQKQCEVSMERYMKCGFGVCGQCCVDNLGVRVCKEGPVFDSARVKEMFEFNKYKRDASGKKIPFGMSKQNN